MAHVKYGTEVNARKHLIGISIFICRYLTPNIFPDVPHYDYHHLHQATAILRYMMSIYAVSQYHFSFLSEQAAMLVLAILV